MGTTKIEWTDDTVNVQSGCTEARRADGSMDPACVHCYARTLSGRLSRMGQAIYDGATTGTGGRTRWTGDIQWNGDLLDRRIAGIRPGRVTFLGSMTDLWHEDAEPSMWADLAAAMRRIDERPSKKRPRGVVTLTKRAGRLLAFQREHFPAGLPSWWWPGVTVADQRGADERLPSLMALRAHGPRVVSYEPAMGPVDWRPWVARRECECDAMGHVSPFAPCHADYPCGVTIGWLIAGGESGPKARPSHPDWFRAARDAAVAAGAPFFFKQWGEWAAVDSGSALASDLGIDRHGASASIGRPEDGDRGWAHATSVEVMRLVGKRAAGRQLDGREWNEVPDAR